MDLSDLNNKTEDHPPEEISEKTKAEILELPFVSLPSGDAKTEDVGNATEPPTYLMALPSDAPATGDAMSKDGGGIVEPEKDTEPPQGVASNLANEEVLTIGEALAYLQSQGFELKERTLQRYCQGNSYGVICEKISTSTGQEWHVLESSLDRYMKDNPDRQIHERQAAPSTDIPATGDASKITQKPEVANKPVKQTPDMPLPSAASDVSIFEHPYVKRLEGQIEKLEGKNEHLQDRVQTVLEDANERLIELQKANAVAQSETLGKFLLEDKRIQNENEKPEPIKATFMEGDTLHYTIKTKGK